VVQDIGHDIEIKCHVETWSLKKIWMQQDLRDVSKGCSGIPVEERKMMHTVTVLLNMWNG
jgi:hypothetical protein